MLAWGGAASLSSWCGQRNRLQFANGLARTVRRYLTMVSQALCFSGCGVPWPALGLVQDSPIGRARGLAPAALQPHGCSTLAASPLLAKDQLAMKRGTLREGDVPSAANFPAP